MNRAIGIGCLALVLLLLVLQPLLAPYDPMAVDVSLATRGPEMAHPLGTDTQGRDVLSRLAAGTRHSVSVAAVALVVSSLVGLLLGALAGLLGGFTDRALSGLTDLLLAFPRFVILLNLAAIFSFGSIVSLGLLIGATSWMGTARLVRTEVLSLRERTFVEAARAAGAPASWVIARHLVPHLLRLVWERAGLRFSAVILLAASLDYLGVGLPLDHPTWGRIIRDGQEFIGSAPWITLSAVGMLCLTSVGLVLTGERPVRR